MLLMTAVSVSAGCGILHRSGNDSESYVPPSNRRIAETVIERAFEDLDIPHGHGLEISLNIDGEGFAGEYAQIFAPEFFFGKGFRIRGKDSTAPIIYITVDTLFVKIDPDRFHEEGKRISRSAKAGIEAVYLEKDGSRKVYKGYGVSQDYFPFDMLHTTENNDPFVIYSDRFITYLKPIVFGLTITLLLWFLYYYRG